MCSHRPVASGFDPGDGIGDVFIAHGHRMGIGVDHRFGIDHQRDMAFPEQQVVALVVTFDRPAHGALLLVTVTRAGDAAGQQRRLHEARTIDPPAAVAAPKVGCAEEQRRDLRGVGLVPIDGGKVAARDMALRGLGKILGLINDRDG